MEQAEFFNASLQIFEGLRDICVRGGQYEFLVSFEAWPDSENRTWEPLTHLPEDVLWIVKDFPHTNENGIWSRGFRIFINDISIVNIMGGCSLKMRTCCTPVIPITVKTHRILKTTNMIFPLYSHTPRFMNSSCTFCRVCRGNWVEIIGPIIN